jgi:tripartite-type tricarboxylate transporter receptor subunit TctC
VQKRFRAAVVAAMQSPEVKAQLLGQGVVAITSTPKEYRDLMQREYDKWRLVIAKGKITLN